MGMINVVRWVSLQWDLGQRDYGDEHDNDDRYGVWVASGYQNIGSHFIVNLLAKHDITRNGDCDVKSILLRLLTDKSKDSFCDALP